jgi:hypothetical protein
MGTSNTTTTTTTVPGTTVAPIAKIQPALLTICISSKITLVVWRAAGERMAVDQPNEAARVVNEDIDKTEATITVHVGHPCLPELTQRRATQTNKSPIVEDRTPTGPIVVIIISSTPSHPGQREANARLTENKDDLLLCTRPTVKRTADQYHRLTLPSIGILLHHHLLPATGSPWTMTTDGAETMMSDVGVEVEVEVEIVEGLGAGVRTAE